MNLLPSVGKVLPCHRGVAKFCTAGIVDETEKNLIFFIDVIVDPDDIFAHIGGHRVGLNEVPIARIRGREYQAWACQDQGVRVKAGSGDLVAWKLYFSGWVDYRCSTR